MRTRTAKLVGTAAAAAGVCLLVTGTANAVPSADGIPEVVAAVGSDTIYDVDTALFTAANSDSANTDPDNYVNVPPRLASGQTFTVPGDVYDPGFTYDSTNPPPDGSTAGKTALANAAAAGTARVDFARSSSGRGASDPATFQYFGFAKDAVTWSALGTGAGANVSLTLTQLRDIYRGTITNWSQVGGTNTPIKLYLPQAGSGTLAFFTGTVLGFDPTTIPGLTINRFQENRGDTIPAADAGAAIAPYSVAQWIAQGNTVIPDNRAGFVEGILTGAGNDGPVVTGTAPNYAPAFADGFLGARTVYHVLDTRTKSYNAALRYFGFDGTGPSPLCSGALASTLSRYGFKPLAASGGVTCTQS